MKLGRTVLLWAGILAVGLPLLWVLVASLKVSLDVIADPWGIPNPPKWANYCDAWTEANIGTGFLNSLIATLGTLVILLPIGSMTAYVFARYPFRGSGALYALMLGGMMFPIFLVIVPLFILMRQLALLNSLPGLILVYVAFSLSFTVFVMRGFFEVIPEELAEAARMDGAGHAGVFWKVMFPLARPGLVVAGIFNAIGLWNEYGLALVLLQKPEVRTLPLAVADLSQTQQYQANFGALFAALVIVMAPLLVAYGFFRRRLHEAMIAGAVKG